ncbi:MAG: hypothetical protein P4M05_26455 [Bradyrhizobium sp.]|nr:hypothetical protein [Bradyrhizobium sp.]
MAQLHAVLRRARQALALQASKGASMRVTRKNVAAADSSTEADFVDESDAAKLCRGCGHVAQSPSRGRTGLIYQLYELDGMAVRCHLVWQGDGNGPTFDGYDQKQRGESEPGSRRGRAPFLERRRRGSKGIRRARRSCGT